MPTMTFLHLNNKIVRKMSLSLSPANQNAPHAHAWWENDRYKRANAWEISLFAVRHRSRNIKIKETRTL